eukprot:COSAG01_NODE_663_length_14420_cov_77.011382_8_plen_63_part_00
MRTTNRPRQGMDQVTNTGSKLRKEGDGCAWIKSQYTMLRTVKQLHNPSSGDEELSLAEWIGK